MFLLYLMRGDCDWLLWVLIQPYLWWVATYLPPKGSRRFYGRDLVAQPARASSQQPVAGGQPWLACRRSQPADTSQAS